MKREKFKDEYVIARGFPWAHGVGPYYALSVNNRAVAGGKVEFKFPKELWLPEVPMYELVLRKVKNEKKDVQK